MAFGRSNSLSINTGATNSLLTSGAGPSPLRQSVSAQEADTSSIGTGAQQQSGTAASPPVAPAPGAALEGMHPDRVAMLTENSGSQQNTNQTSQPEQQQQQGGGLFGGGGANTQTSQAPRTDGLFGRLQTSQPQQQQQSTSLFRGGATTSQPQQSGGLFGSTTTSQPQQGGGLFGSATTSQPQQTSSLFGNTASNTQQQSNTGLFGSSLNPPAQQQNAGSSSLFGGSTANQPTSGLFGGSTSNTAQPSNNNLFGGNTGTSSLFGGSTNIQQQQQPSNSLFGGSTNQQQQQQPSNSIFGLTATNPNSQPPTSLLNASQYRSSQLGPFSGKLTLGQPSSQQQQGGASTQQYDYQSMKPTTRFADIKADIQSELEAIDRMIAAQEKFAREIAAFIPKHGADVQTLAPDVEFVTEKTEAAETALALDAQRVANERRILEKDGKDGERIKRVVDNLRQPPQYHAHPSYTSTSNEDEDMDLIGNFFTPLASDLSKQLHAYGSNLAEVEGHLGVMEASAPGRGGNGGVSSVGDLADVLGGFEGAILGVAGAVGRARDGVNEVVVGRGFSMR
ncbi:hypothetical protein LTR37_003205 [Vermiconidia calcicola]|uniref:Uncharacterized protein n=1 Tax=Vermiconidia calcicola TaxID=1690605 RepID=A0ACC3NTA0_9PEZI|nr:hypothetical protein LTR37_003205 [Vermiconidia calcicola]